VEKMPVVVVSDIKIKEDDEAYLEKHKIAEMMQKLLERVLKDKPARPVSFMIEEIWRLRDEHITQTLEEAAAKQ